MTTPGLEEWHSYTCSRCGEVKKIAGPPKPIEGWTVVTFGTNHFAHWNKTWEVHDYKVLLCPKCCAAAVRYTDGRYEAEFHKLPRYKNDAGRFDDECTTESDSDTGSARADDAISQP